MPGAPLSDASEEFLSWLGVERGRAANTLSSYRRDLAAYEETLHHQGRRLEEARVGDVDRHLAILAERGASPASRARALSSIRGLHRFMLDEGWSAGDPTASVLGGRLPARLPKALSEDQVFRLLDSIGGTGPADRRDRALLELLYGTGARISEAVGLDLADLTSGDGLVRLYGKGSKERMVPLGRQAGAALAEWLGPSGRERLAPARWRRRGDAEAVFLNARGGRLSRQGAFAVVQRHGAAVGLAGRVSPHTLRHSCASHMLAHGADIRVVQELLGHASIATTQLYTKVSAEHLRAAYEAAHPRAAGPGGRRPRTAERGAPPG